MIRALEYLQSTHDLRNVVIVLDNTPSHNSIKDNMPNHLKDISFLRLVPYSAPLSIKGIMSENRNGF